MAVQVAISMKEEPSTNLLKGPKYIGVTSMEGKTDANFGQPFNIVQVIQEVHIVDSAVGSGLK